MSRINRIQRLGRLWYTLTLIGYFFGPDYYEQRKYLKTNNASLETN